VRGTPAGPRHAQTNASVEMALCVHVDRFREHASVPGPEASLSDVRLPGLARLGLLAVSEPGRNFRWSPTVEYIIYERDRPTLKTVTRGGGRETYAGPVVLEAAPDVVRAGLRIRAIPSVNSEKPSPAQHSDCLRGDETNGLLNKWHRRSSSGLGLPTRLLPARPSSAPRSPGLLKHQHRPVGRFTYQAPLQRREGGIGQEEVGAARAGRRVRGQAAAEAVGRLARLGGWARGRESSSTPAGSGTPRDGVRQTYWILVLPMSVAIRLSGHTTRDWVRHAYWLVADHTIGCGICARGWCRHNTASRMIALTHRGIHCWRRWWNLWCRADSSRTDGGGGRGGIT
jgi:hypothetical protein